ncbi:MAG: hypothetical protein M3R36_18610 [Bacteroidota bacterium]|nr:hypothetical protein [Bacteroidota bacterium]
MFIRNINRINSNTQQSPGRFSIKWDGKYSNSDAASSGIYFYSITTGHFSSTRKMLLIK